MNSFKPTNQKIRSRQFKQTELVSQNLKKQQPYKGILGSGKTSKKMKLTMWNVNGIRSVLSKYAMRDFIAKYNPDFICINQTKINAQLYTKEKIKIKEYHDYWNFCKCSAGYSGVAIFAKYQPLSIFEDLQQPQYSQEGRVLTLQYQMFYLVVVYIPSAGDKQLKRLSYKVNKYEVAFQNYCQKLKTKGKGVIVCGDFNVSHQQIDIHVTPYVHKQPGFTPQERISFKKFLNKGWVDTFRKLNPNLKKYTWWRIQHKNRDRNIGRRLDYFLVNDSFFKVVKNSVVLDDVMGSDHCPILMQIELSVLQSQENTLKKGTNLLKDQKVQKSQKKDYQSQTKDLTCNSSSEKNPVTLKQQTEQEQKNTSQQVSKNQQRLQIKTKEFELQQNVQATLK